MKTAALLLVIFILSLFESTFLPFLIVPVLAVAIALVFGKKTALFTLFLAGIIYDLVLVYPQGSSSLFFLITFVLIDLYQKKFSKKNLIYLFFFSALTLFVYSNLKGLNQPLLTIFLNSLLIYIVYPLLLAVNSIFDKPTALKIKI